jgi:hypothetical protein
VEYALYQKNLKTPKEKYIMSKLFQSRKFLLVVLDAAVVLTAVVVSQFAPDWTAFAASISAPFAAVISAAIIGIALEDAAALKAGSHPNQAE